MGEGMKLGTQHQRRGGQWDQRDERRGTPDALGRWGGSNVPPTFSTRSLLPAQTSMGDFVACLNDGSLSPTNLSSRRESMREEGEQAWPAPLQFPRDQVEGHQLCLVVAFPYL